MNDASDWYKYFKCSSIDPTVLPGEKIHEIRSRELKRLIVYKFIHYPRQAFTLLGRLARNMPWRDVVYLIVKPFLGKKSGQTNAEVISRAVEREQLMSAAADFTQVPDAPMAVSASDRRCQPRPPGRPGPSCPIW